MKHTIDSANLSLKNKKLDSFLSVKSIINTTVTIIDADYGPYQIDVKMLSPKTNVPLHKKRRHYNKVDAINKKYVGLEINEHKILNVFYGPDRGYKNRSFYVEYVSSCGHIGITTYATLAKHKKTIFCFSCANTDHGERKKIDGKLKKRTNTYIHWQRIKSILPEIYQDFSVFKKSAGDKPFKKADIIFIDNKPTWIELQLDQDPDLNLIAMAIRQAFRHSTIYKNAIEKSRIETDKGSRYRCAECGELFKRSEVQVDHINPIADLDGSPLTKEGLIDKIVTENIQILDKKCHTIKSTKENKIRKEAKKGKNKK